MSWLRRQKSPTPSPAADKAILDAAVATLSKNPDATLRAIAHAAKVDVGTLEARYGDRDGLIEAAAERGSRRLASSTFLDDGTPAEQIAMFVARLWDDQERGAQFASLAIPPKTWTAVDPVLEPMRALLADAVARGAADGTLRSDVPPETVAWLIERELRTCLEAYARGKTGASGARNLAKRQALAVAGLSWTDAQRIANQVSGRLG